LEDLRLDTNFIDYAIIAVYFVAVLGIGFAAKRYIKTSLDYFLSGRSLPAWITGLAFISANLGALEILGQSANGAQYGVATVHFFWVGAIPAMVFLGIVMMPFYYGSKVRSVPEYLRLRFNNPTHVFNAASFAVGTVLIAGVNLYALALVLQLLLGIPIIVGVVVSAAIVLAYITLGGFSSAIYNEVLQFFIILAALIPRAVPDLRRRPHRAWAVRLGGGDRQGGGRQRQPVDRRRDADRRRGVPRVGARRTGWSRGARRRRRLRGAPRGPLITAAARPAPAPPGPRRRAASRPAETTRARPHRSRRPSSARRRRRPP